MFGPSLLTTGKTNGGHTHLMGGGDCALIINMQPALNGDHDDDDGLGNVKILNTFSLSPQPVGLLDSFSVCPVGNVKYTG